MHSQKIIFSYYFHFCFILTLMCNLFLFSGESIAQGNLKLKAEIPPKLFAGNIHAELPLQGNQKNHARGSFAFAEIKVFNKGKRRYENAELELQAEHSTIKSVINLSNENSKIRHQSEGRRILKIRRLTKRTPQIIWVELKLEGNDQEIIKRTQESGLKITLRTRTKKGEQLSDSTRLTWRIANCASSYHKALSHVGEAKTVQMYEALQDVRKIDRTLPRRQLYAVFRTYKNFTVYRNICTRHRYFRNRHTGKRYKKCLSSRKVKKTIRSLVKLPSEEQKIFREVRKFIAARGIDPRFRKNSGHYWVTKKIYADLKRYLRQQSNPALCTGVEQMTEYYEGKFEQVKKRATEIQTLLKKALSLATFKTSQYLNALAQKNDDASETVQPTDISLKIPRYENLSSPHYLNELLLRIVSASKKPEIISIMQGHNTIFHALKKFRGNFSNYKKELALDKAIQKKLYSSLAMIEAASYFQLISVKYGKIVQTFEESFSAIRRAHKFHCNC